MSACLFVCLFVFVFVCLFVGDHKLSYREFIAVMKGWKLRGFKVCDGVMV